MGKSNEKGGFVVGTNAISKEKLSAAGATAAVFVGTSLLRLIAGKKSKKNGSKKVKKRKKSIILRLAAIPTVYKIADAALTQIKLSGIVSKVKKGEDVTTPVSQAVPDDIEVIFAEPIASEDELKDHI